MLNVEVAFALPEKQFLVAVQVAKGSNALDAVRVSKIVEACPELQQQELVLGIFSQRLKQPESYVMKEGDRVEIYRPLLIDPKQARRDRAKRNKR